MTTQQYSVTPHTIDTLLTWVKSGAIAIPEIQRPFVWEASKVRDLLDSLYRGYPIGYLISWQNPTVRLKDGSLSSGKRILIDGQQRVTALMAALLGMEVLTKDYKKVRIQISFNPLEEKFEVANPALLKSNMWIPDVATLMDPATSMYKVTTDYVAANDGADPNEISNILTKVGSIKNNNVGVIDLASNLDIETVTEIFIRVNSSGAQLSQADFAMSKIAANESSNGTELRKAIDYFCHMAVNPGFAKTIQSHDPQFAKSDYFKKMKWLSNLNEDIYDPTYTDVLRVAFMSQFSKGKIQDLVALLSGRNFETKQYEQDIVDESFSRLKSGVFDVFNETNFTQLVQYLRSAGFVTSSMVGSKNAVNFAYVLFLIGKKSGLKSGSLEQAVRRWYAMAVLTGRNSGSVETTFDLDLSQTQRVGVIDYVDQVVAAELDEGFWTAQLPASLETSSTSSPYFAVFRAAQAKLQSRGFLSSDILVSDLLSIKGDAHHLYPKSFLKKQGLGVTKYNQIANLAIAQSDINLAIGDKSPELYFGQLAKQVAGGKKLYGGITDRQDLEKNFRENALPLALLDGDILDYDEFLAQRRHLMAEVIRRWFHSL